MEVLSIKPRSSIISVIKNHFLDLKVKILGGKLVVKKPSDTQRVSSVEQ